MQNKYIPIRALSEGCEVVTDSAGNSYCPTDQPIPENQPPETYSNRFVNTTPDNPDDAPEIDYNADARYWTPDQKISYDTGRPYDKVTPNEDTWSRDRSVPYEGYRSPNEPRALLVDPQLGTLRFAPNQDSYGNPNYGTSGGWNSDFSGGGGSGGGYTDFSGTASA